MARPDAEGRAPGRRDGLVLGLALLVSAALYAPSLAGDFPFDDQFVARAEYAPGQPNPMVSELRPLSEYLTSHYWRGWRDTGLEYRPVTILSYATTYRLAGRASAETRLGEAFPQRLVNLLLHLLATVLAWRLLLAAGAPRRAALLGTVVFALHALRSEAVASIVGRAELLAFAFGCGACLAALSGWDRHGGGRAARVAAAALLFVLAFGSKESALAWPGMLFLLAWVRGGALPPLRRLAHAVVLPLLTAAVPLVVFLWLRAHALGSLPETPLPDPMVNPLAHVSTGARWLSAVAIWGYGLGLVLAPFRLACDYGLAVFPVLEHPFDPRFLASALALAGLAVGGLLAARRHPLLLLAAASFLGTSFLTSNLPVVIGTVFGERLLYTPALGLSFALAWAVRHAPAAPRPRRLAAAAMGLWLAASATTTLQRALVWRDNATLYLHDVAVQPRSARLHYLAADYWMLQGDRALQFHHLERAFALKPEVARAWLRLAWFFQRQQRLDEAREALRRGLAAARDEDARYRFHLTWTRVEVLEALASPDLPDALADARAAFDALVAQPDVLASLREALAENPPAVRTWLVAALHLQQAGALSEAERALREGLAALTPLAEAQAFLLHWNLVGVLDAEGRRAEARAALDAALHADPDAVRERLELVWGLRERGWEVAALAEIFDAGAALRPDDPLWPLYRGLAAARLGERELAEWHLSRALARLDAHPRLEEAKRALRRVRASS